MNKKLLMFTIVPMVLSMMISLPVKAKKTVEPYASHVEVELIDPGEVWEADGILHMKGSYWNGTEVGTLGTAIFEEWYNHFSVNLETGKGTASAKWRLTFPEGTLAGIWRGKITLGSVFSGTFVGTHGTGAFEGVKKMGSVEGVMIDETHAEAEISGIVVFP